MEFVPDDREDDGQHGFKLKRGKFLHDLGRDNLTIKSNDKTYRFKPTDTTGTDGAQFARFVGALSDTPSGLRQSEQH
jgi:hypothetical protein